MVRALLVLAPVLAWAVLVGCSGDGAGASEPFAPDAGGSDASGTSTEPNCGRVSCESRHDFELQLGVVGANKTFRVPRRGDPIEIVQGPQGGVHVEIALQARLPVRLAGDTLRTWIRATTFEPCDAATGVGRAENRKYLLFPDGNGNHISGVLPVVFATSTASAYEDTECCVRVTLGVREPGETEPSLWATTEHRFYCIDFF